MGVQTKEMNMTTNPTTKAPATAADAYQQIKQRAGRYNDRDLAFQSAAHGVKPLWVMLGDDEKFWVVTPADAARMERMGYEYAM